MAETKTTAKKKPQDRKPKATAPINIGASRGTIEVNLVGVTYNVRVPKGISTMVFAQKLQELQGDENNAEKLLETLEEWLVGTFGDEDGNAIVARLYDDQDDLDFTQVMELMEALIERATANPST